MHCNYSNSNSHVDCLSDQSTFYIDQEVSKHIQSLRTRLSFAKFKLNNGWENNSIFDIECLWKNKQKKLVNDIPIPRFTQQDIIDRRYIKKRSKSLPHVRPEVKKLKQQKSDITKPFAIKNSLDYLSYAIAITENNQSSSFSDSDDSIPSWKTSQLRLSLSIPHSNDL